MINKTRFLLIHMKFIFWQLALLEFYLWDIIRRHFSSLSKRFMSLTSVTRGKSVWRRRKGEGKGDEGEHWPSSRASPRAWIQTTNAR